MIHVLETWIPIGVLLGLLLLGIGLLLDTVSRVRLPTALLLPLGLCGTIVLSEGASALHIPVVVLAVVVALGGLVGLRLGRDRLRFPRAGWWGIAAVVATWGVYTMVAALTGEATFPGYTILGDPAIHLVGADALPGPPGAWADQAGAFRSFFAGYYKTGYPEGGASTLGLLSTLTGSDPVHTIYPLIVMSMTALTASVWSLLGPVIGRPWARAGVAALAAFPALTFSFVMQSSLKEVLEMATIATLFASTGPLLTAAAVGRSSAGDATDEADASSAPADPWRALARDAIAPAVAVGAAVASIGLAAAVYVVPGALIVLVALLMGRGWRRTLVLVGWVGLISVILMAPSLIGLRSYLNVSGTVLTSQVELGNLYAGPLIVREIWGVWLANDFRQLPPNLNNTTHAADVMVALVVFGCLRLLAPLLRRARPAIPLMAWVVAVAVATPFVMNVGSPWADAKAMAIAGPTILVAAGAGAWWLMTSRWLRLPAVLLAGVALAAVTVSVATAAYQVGMAPEDRFNELATIDNRFEGQGPMVVAEFEEFTRHLLRKVPATFVSDPYLMLKTKGDYGISSDQDQLSPAQVQRFKLMLVRSGPAASRPPSNFVRRWSGRYYEVWAKDPSLPVPRVHLSLGDIQTGGAIAPSCSTLTAFAGRARPGEAIVAAERQPVIGLPFGQMKLPINWAVDPIDPRTTHPYGSGTFDFTMTAPAPGALVDVWLEGSFTRKITVVANGVARSIGPMALNPRQDATRVVTVRADGQSRVHIVITRPARALRTGWGNLRAIWGPVSITPHDPLGAERLVHVAPGNVRQLCGTSLDWAELVPIVR